MHFFPNTNKRTQFQLLFFLSIALLSCQGMKFHLHNLDHDLDDLHHAHDSVAAEHAHMTLSNLHPLNDLSHSDHHDQKVSEIDLGQNGLLKNLVSKVPTLAFLVSIFSILLSVYIRNTNFRHPKNDAVTYWVHHFSPPLRAPPL
jgi:hypothetical protein